MREAPDEFKKSFTFLDLGNNCVDSEEKTQNDLQLIAAINRGDAAAFEILYRRYREWVHQLAYRFTGSHQDAQDVLQETFAYVVQKFPGFELTSSMKTFLYPAIRNYSIALRKKRKRSVQDESMLELAVSDDDPSATQTSDLRHLLSSLSPSQQQVLMMRFVDDMTMPEIAAALEISTGTVKSRIHYAVRSLRESPVARAYFEGEGG